MYLEAGMVPARYQVERQVLNFVHYILQQDKNFLLLQILSAIIEKPTRNDWLGVAKLLVQKYNLELKLLEIEKIKTISFQKLVKTKMEKVTFSELT